MIYSTPEVRKLLSIGSLILSDLPSRRLSESQVIVETQNKGRIDILTSPSGYEHDAVIDLLLHFFTLPHYATRLGIARKRAFSGVVHYFFDFVENGFIRHLHPPNNHNLGVSQKTLPPHIFNNWLDHLKKNTSASATYRSLQTMSQLFTTTATNRYGKISQWPVDIKSAWQILRSIVPPQPQSPKAPPLGHYLGIPTSDFSNRELLMGLRFGVLWILLRMQRFRESFSAYVELEKWHSELKDHDLEGFSRVFSGLSDVISGSKRNPETPIKSKFLTPVSLNAWRAVLNDPLLTEWQFYSWPRLRKALIPRDKPANPFTVTSQIELLNRFHESGSLRFRPRGYGKNDTKWAELKIYLGAATRSNISLSSICFWGTDWLVPSNIEKLLMVWLLASERAQKSGIENLKLTNAFLSSNKSSIQISTLKLRRMSNAPRSKSRQTDVESQIYKRNTPPYQVYNNWLELNKRASSTINGYNSEQKFILYRHRIDGLICDGRSNEYPNSLLPLNLISVPGTIWHDTFLSEAGPEGRSEAEAFIAIMKNRVEYKRSNPSAPVSLPVSPIGQSLVLEKALENNIQEASSSVEAEAMGHNETTSRLYKDGFSKLNIDELLEPIQAFARKVGDQKIVLAHKLAEKLASSNRRVTLSELEQLSGIRSASIDQLQLLKNLDEEERLTIAGEILLNGEILIVETDVTAGMMWGYIKHLESNLPNLIISDRDDTTVRNLAQLIYLHHAFKRFDYKLQLAGREIAAKTEFPFPPVI